MLLGKLTFAQQYFSDTTTNDSYGSLYAGLALENDSTFYTLGIYDGYDPSLKVQLMISKHYNNQVFNRWVRGRADRYYFMRDIKKYGELLCIAGTIPVNSPFPNQPFYNAYMLIMNTNGDSILYKEFDSGLPDVTFSSEGIIKLGSEIWLAISWRRVTSNSVLDQKVCLLRLDSLGNEKARYLYGSNATGFSQIPRGLDVNADNEIIVAAGDCQGCTGNGTPINQAWIFAVDTSGQLLRQYFTPPVNNRGAAFKSSTTADGGAIFSAVKIHNYPQPNGTTNYRYQGSVIKLNSQLQLEWDSIYGIESLSTNLAHVVPDRSGGYVAVGTHSNPNHPRVGWMTKLNAQGEMQWQRFFLPFPSLQDPQWGYLEHVAVTELGNIVAAGRGENHTSALDHAQYAWIIKTDSMGCLVPGCAVSLRELTTEPVYLKAWPNPVSEVLNVLVKSEKPLHGAQFKLIDMVGRTQRQWEGSYEELQYQIAVHDLPAGLYVLQLVKGGQLLAREKVVVTH
ncbi:MAG: T9SS type A sorting domain-containing protein [Bacteroidia bacterium]